MIKIYTPYLTFKGRSLNALSLFSNDAITVECVFPAAPEVAVAADASFYSEMALIPVQTHSLDVEIVSASTTLRPEADGIITFESNTPVGVVTADCVPIILFAPDINAVAAVHAGWKGTLGGIIDNAVGILSSYGGDPRKLIAVFGPSISVGIYEVNQELADSFIKAGFGDCVRHGGGEDCKPHIDLQGVNAKRLLSFGLMPDNIRLSSYCSYLTQSAEGKPLLPSHRRSGGNPDRLLTRVWIKTQSR